MLWQFVLRPEHEEPLDLLDDMIRETREWPPLWMDRFASVAGWDRIASRRIFVLLSVPAHTPSHGPRPPRLCWKTIFTDAGAKSVQNVFTVYEMLDPYADKDRARRLLKKGG